MEVLSQDVRPSSQPTGDSGISPRPPISRPSSCRRSHRSRPSSCSPNDLTSYPEAHCFYNSHVWTSPLFIFPPLASIDRSTSRANITPAVGFPPFRAQFGVDNRFADMCLVQLECKPEGFRRNSRKVLTGSFSPHASRVIILSGRSLALRRSNGIR